MEEKERYTIESFEVDEPSCIFDNKTQQRILTFIEYNYDEIVNLEKLLNQCDKRIKELEEELKKYKSYKTDDERIKDLTNLYGKYAQENQQLKIRVKNLKEKISIQLNNNADNVNFMENQRKENQQLKQQLHELSQDIFGEIKKKSFKCYAPEDKKKITEYILDSQTFDTILKKYGVQNENNKK